MEVENWIWQKLNKCLGELKLPKMLCSKLCKKLMTMEMGKYTLLYSINKISYEEFKNMMLGMQDKNLGDGK